MQEICEISGCSNSVAGDSYYDKYYKKRVCVSCFHSLFKAAETHALGEWFEANYNKEDYPKDFWNKVGAFVDLSKTKTGGVYK